MRVLVTGANGYIGRKLISAATSRGYKIVAASRRPVDHVDHWLEFDMSRVEELSVPGELQVIYHLAANVNPVVDKYSDEARSVESLIKLAREKSAKLVFASSQAADQDASTRYGQIKWKLEKLVAEGGGVVARIGQVYGGAPEGLFGLLIRIVNRFPVLPYFLPSPKVNPIHIDDCVEGLLRIGESENSSLPMYKLGSAEQISFNVFLMSIARDRLRVFRVFVPVPTLLVRALCIIVGPRIADVTGLSRLNSLFRLKPMESVHDLDRLDLRLRKLSSGMNKSGFASRRYLLEEGAALLTYILKEFPSMSLVRRYAKAVESLKDGRPLYMRRYLKRFPSMIALFDRPIADKGAAQDLKELSYRIDIATLIAEASPQGGKRFLLLGYEYGLLNSLSSMTGVLMSELFWRIIRLLQSLKLLNFKMTESHE